MKVKDGLYTEIQAGSYLLMDASYKALDVPFENALYILATVSSSRKISITESKVVLNTGIKSCAIDQGLPVCEELSGKLEAHEEHIIAERTHKLLPIGTRLKLIPAHCCTTVNLYDQIYIVDNDNVIDKIAVTSRGRSR